MEEQILDKVIVIHPDIHLWSGRKRLRQEDLERVSADQLPPETLASLGSKRICDPKDLNIFDRIKKRFERECAEVGIRFLSGYAIPEARIDGLLKAVHRHRDDFETARRDFLNRYQERIDNWVSQNPEWGRIIRRAVTPKEEVAAQLRFDFQAFRVKAVDDESDDSSSMTRKAGALPERLFHEIANEARDSLDSFEGRDKIGRRALRPFVRIREKLAGLSFLDKRVAPVISWIDEKLDLVPANGPIEGSLVNDLYAAMTLLSSPEQIKQLGGSRQQRIDNAVDSSSEPVPFVGGSDDTDLPAPAHFDAQGLLDQLGPLSDEPEVVPEGQTAPQTDVDEDERKPELEPAPEEGDEEENYDSFFI